MNLSICRYLCAVPTIPKMPVCTYLFGDLFDLRVDDDTTQNISTQHPWRKKKGAAQAVSENFAKKGAETTTSPHPHKQQQTNEEKKPGEPNL